jgi:hypothetical protein
MVALAVCASKKILYLIDTQSIGFGNHAQDLGGEPPCIPKEAHMYSWFIRLYVPCTGDNLYKNTTYIHAPSFL